MTRALLFLAALIWAGSAGAQVANGPRMMLDGSIHSPSGSYSLDGTRGIGAFKGLTVTGIGQVGQFAAGTSGAPVTTVAPSINIARTEAINNVDTENASNPALYVTSIGNNVSTAPNIAMTTAISAFATQIGQGDAVALFGYGVNSGTGGHYAYGGFMNGVAYSAGTHAIGAEIFSENRTGSDAPYAIGATPSIVGAHIGAGGTNLPTTAIWVTNNTSGGTQQWDTGLVFHPGSIRTFSIVDDSTSGSSYVIAGSHQYGINLSAGTFTGAQLFLNNLKVLPSGTIQTIVAPQTAWTFDASGAQAAIATGSNLSIATGNGLIVVEDSVTSSSAVYLCSTGACTLVTANGATWVASTTTPAAGKMSIAWGGSSYVIANNEGATELVAISGTKLKASN